MSGKYRCGQLLPSSCIPYTGSPLSFLTALNPVVTLDCNANIDDVFSLIDTTLLSLLQGNNLKTINNYCLDFDPATITPAGLHQIEVVQICGLITNFGLLQTQVNELNIGSMLLTIDLQCLTPAAAPCLVPPNQYSLQSILTVMLSEICALKNALGI